MASWPKGRMLFAKKLVAERPKSRFLEVNKWGLACRALAIQIFRRACLGMQSISGMACGLRSDVCLAVSKVRDVPSHTMARQA